MVERNDFDPRVKPTEDTVLREMAEQEKMWDGALAAMAEVDEVYCLADNIWAAYEAANPTAKGLRPQYHSKRAQSLVDGAVNAQLAYMPTVTRYHLDDNAEHHAADDRVEEAVQHIIRDMFMWSANIPPKLNGKQLILHNHTQLWLTMDNDVLEKPVQADGEDKEEFEHRVWEWESRHVTWNPLRFEVPAPGEVLMSPLGKNPDVAFRRRTMRAYQLEVLTTKKAALGYGEQWSKGAKDAYEPVKVVERWTSRWIAILGDGKLLSVEPNPWWLQPCLQTWWGTNDLPAGKEFDPAYWVRQSMLFGVKEALNYRNQQFVASQKLVINASFAKVGYNGNPAEAAEQMEGDILSGVEADWWTEKLPQFPQQLLAESERLDRDIEENTYSMQAKGFREQGVRTATEYLALAQNVSREFQAPVIQLEGLYTHALSNGLRMYYRLSQEYPKEWQEINAGEKKLRIKDLGDPPSFHIQARFEQVDVVTALQEKQAADLDFKEGRIDYDTWAKKAGYENPAQIKKGIWRDRIMQMPEVMTEQAIIALREAHMDKIADEKETEMKMAAMQKQMQAQNGQQGQSMMPPQGGNNAQPAPSV